MTPIPSFPLNGEGEWRVRLGQETINTEHDTPLLVQVNYYDYVVARSVVCDACLEPVEGKQSPRHKGIAHGRCIERNKMDNICGLLERSLYEFSGCQDWDIFIRFQVEQMWIPRYDAVCPSLQGAGQHVIIIPVCAHVLWPRYAGNHACKRAQKIEQRICFLRCSWILSRYPTARDDIAEFFQQVRRYHHLKLALAKGIEDGCRMAGCNHPTDEDIRIKNDLLHDQVCPALREWP